MSLIDTILIWAVASITIIGGIGVIRALRSPPPTRSVAPTDPWPFVNHRTLAEVFAAERGKDDAA